MQCQIGFTASAPGGGKHEPGPGTHVSADINDTDAPTSRGQAEQPFLKGRLTVTAHGIGKVEPSPVKNESRCTDNPAPT